MCFLQRALSLAASASKSEKGGTMKPLGWSPVPVPWVWNASILQNYPRIYPCWKGGFFCWLPSVFSQPTGGKARSAKGVAPGRSCTESILYQDMWEIFHRAHSEYSHVHCNTVYGNQVWKPANHLLMDEWVKILWHAYAVEYKLAFKKEVLTFSTVWRKLEGFVC